MSDDRNDKPPAARGSLDDVFDAAAKGLGDLKREVIRDAHQIKDEVVKYGQNRLICGGAMAFKGAVLGSVLPVVGTKIGAMSGFVIGFIGGPPLARRLEKAFDKAVGKTSAPDAAPNTTPAAPKPGDPAP